MTFEKYYASPSNILNKFNGICFQKKKKNCKEGFEGHKSHPSFATV